MRLYQPKKRLKKPDILPLEPEALRSETLESNVSVCFAYSSSVLRAFEESFLGIWHCVIITRFPELRPRKLLNPLPVIIILLPTEHPLGIFISSFDPSMLSISI